MGSIETYKKIFVDSLSLNNSENIEKLEYNIIPEWDSIGHMSLIAALEEEYKISLETDDIIDFSSFKKGIEILIKYGVSFPNAF
jgi:acyl carrier protein